MRDSSNDQSETLLRNCLDDLVQQEIETPSFDEIVARKCQHQNPPLLNRRNSTMVLVLLLGTATWWNWTGEVHNYSRIATNEQELVKIDFDDCFAAINGHFRKIEQETRLTNWSTPSDNLLTIDIQTLGVSNYVEN